MDFSQMLNSQQQLDSLTKQIKSANSNRPAKDERFWELSTNQAGNGQAIIRFLPMHPSDEEAVKAPYVKLFTHAFQNQNRWFIRECPTTIGQQCPICEHNSTLYATGTNENKNIVSKRKRQVKYVSNIYVVKDPSNPDNDGKVFLFKYGVKIFNKIMEALTNELDPESKFNAFDPILGADFTMKCAKVGGFNNYDSSVFGAPKPLFKVKDTQNLTAAEKKKFIAVFENQHPLNEFLDPDKFDSFDKLKKDFDKVLGATASIKTAEQLADAAPTKTDTSAFSIEEDEEETGLILEDDDELEDTTEKSTPHDPEGDEDEEYFKSLIDD